MNGLAWTLLWPCTYVLSVCRFPFISLISKGIREIIIVIICFADSGGWNIHYHALSWICWCHMGILPPPPPEIIPYGKRPLWRNTIWQTFPRKKSHGRTSPGGKQYHMVKFPLYGKYSPPPTHTNFMIREQIPWEIVPAEIIPYGKRSPWRNIIWQTFPRKKSHSRTSPGGNNTIWQASRPEEIPWQNFPLYGKSPPTQIPYVILGQHVRFVLGGGGG